MLLWRWLHSPHRSRPTTTVSSFIRSWRSVPGSGAPPACPSRFLRDGGSLLCRQLLRTGLAALQPTQTPERDGGGVLPLRLLDECLDASERRLVRIVYYACSVWHVA